MGLYRIAGIVVEYEPHWERLRRQMEPYRASDTQIPEVTLNLSKEDLEEKRKAEPHLTAEQFEYIWVGCLFYSKLIQLKKGFPLHASAVALNQQAYLFSAPSGTGKSTHTQQWINEYGGRGAFIINDDKPALVYDQGVWQVYGTPFSGKTDLNRNVKVPLKAIAVLERGRENEISRIPMAQAVYSILNQSIRPSNPVDMEKLMWMLDSVLREAPVYRIKCNISGEAARLAYAEMLGGKNEI